MRSSVASALRIVFGLSAAAYAHDALGTLTPCPDCPTSIAPAAITITSQYQPVSTCTPEKVCTKKNCHLEPYCSTYDWVSTEVPCLGGATSTLITKTDQIVELSHVSTVLTSYAPCATKAPAWNGNVPKYQNVSSCTSTTYQTMIVDLSAPFNECGPLALGNWGGSGLCSDCIPDSNTTSQVVHVSKCLDGACSTYAETWVSSKATATASPSECPTPVVTSTYVSSNGVHTIPITKTYTPTGSAYSEPVTITVLYTTTVTDAPKTIECTTIVTLTFTQVIYPVQTAGSGPIIKPTAPASNPAHATGKPSQGSSGSGGSSGGSSEGGSTSGGSSEGSYPEGGSSSGGSGSGVGGSSEGGSGSKGGSGSHNHGGGVEYTTSTVYATHTKTIVSSDSTIVTTVVVPVSTTVCPVEETTPASGPASASYAPSKGSSGPSKTGKSPSYPASTAGGVTGTPTGSKGHPTAPPTVGSCDVLGCFGSSDGFANFTLVETSAKMSIELCTSECVASGYPYSGLHEAECYCAAALDENCGAEKATGVCDCACPGSPSESCGGNGLSSKKLKRSIPILLNVYECTLPTTTTATETSTTTSSAPDKSSDPDPEPEKRSLQADMELDTRTAREIKLRRGGMLSSPSKAHLGLHLKRDFGLKQPFGL